MRAATTLNVTEGMDVDIHLRLNVGELKGLLAATKDLRAWPLGPFRSVLEQSLEKAVSAYSSEHEIEP